MTRTRFARIIVTLLLLTSTFVAPALAVVEIKATAKLQLKETPKDVAVSFNGKWVFILTDSNQLLVYTAAGNLSDTLKLSTTYEKIAAGPDENVVYLTDTRNRVVEAVNLEFVREINISGSPVKGAATAPVTIAVFSDFQCPYCSRIGALLDQAMEKYPNKIKVVYKHFPLNSHPFAVKAAVASMAAMAQGKFWEYHDLLYKNMNQFTDETFAKLAGELKLDKDAFGKHMSDPQTINKVREDWKEGVDIGIQGTPTVYVNGRVLKGRSIEDLSAMVEAALAANPK